jgi:tetratricopeptide (TPR) repeat protein
VIQVVSIAAALLLTAILIYGITTTKSITPQQDNTSGADVQQQASTNPPSADVLHEIDRLRQIVDKNPADLVSTLRLSNMLQDNGMYDQAVVYYKRYLDKIPDNIDARVDYGVTLYEGGHTQEAIEQLNRAIKMNPNHQKAFFNLGIVYLNAGEIDKSNDALKKSVQIDPQSDVGKQAQQILQEHANIKN